MMGDNYFLSMFLMMACKSCRNDIPQEEECLSSVVPAGLGMGAYRFSRNLTNTVNKVSSLQDFGDELSFIDHNLMSIVNKVLFYQDLEREQHFFMATCSNNSDKSRRDDTLLTVDVNLRRKIQRNYLSPARTTLDLKIKE